MMDELLGILHALRIDSMQSEREIQDLIERTLRGNGMPYRREVTLFPGARIDFMCGSTGIEVKKQRPSPKSLREQIRKYLSSDEVQGLIVVAGRGVTLPDRMAGKPVRVVCLDRLWGISI